MCGAGRFKAFGVLNKSGGRGEAREKEKESQHVFLFFSIGVRNENVRDSLVLRCCSNLGVSPIDRQWTRTGQCLDG
jgi:hypothetical protein